LLNQLVLNENIFVLLPIFILIHHTRCDSAVPQIQIRI